MRSSKAFSQFVALVLSATTLTACGGGGDGITDRRTDNYFLSSLNQQGTPNEIIMFPDVTNLLDVSTDDISSSLHISFQGEIVSGNVRDNFANALTALRTDLESSDDDNIPLIANPSFSVFESLGQDGEVIGYIYEFSNAINTGVAQYGTTTYPFVLHGLPSSAEGYVYVRPSGLFTYEGILGVLSKANGYSGQPDLEAFPYAGQF